MAGNVVLVGFSGTGKSNAGRLAATYLGWCFVDTDDLLVERFHMQIGEYFRIHGETPFRDAESEAVVIACDRTRNVIAVGGGAIVRDQNREALRQGNLVIRLNAPIATIFERLTTSPGAEERPMLSGADPRGRMAVLLDEREPLYRQSDATIQTGNQSIDDVAREIVRLAQLRWP